MTTPTYLTQALVYFGAAALIVPLFKRIGLGSVLGYLVAGILIGPYALGLIADPQTVLAFSELGIVFLLFLVGLELNPTRLWAMRKTIFGLGLLQVVVTIGVIAVLSKLTGLSWPIAVVCGMVAAMSSTAIALQVLGERSLVKTPAGESAFAVSLFQDLGVVPLMLILGLLSPAAEASSGLFNWQKIGIAIALIVGMILIGRFLLKPVLRMIAKTGMREIFIATAMLLIMGSALLTATAGLSMAMGAFLAGVLLADSEFRIELEVDIEPFKGLLLGLFFIAVGMSIDLQLIAAKPFLIVGLAITAVAIKFAILWLLAGRFKLCKADGWIFALSISQIGEFAFVLTSVAQTEKVLPKDMADLLNAVVAFSMLTTPLLFLLYGRYIEPRFAKSNTRPAEDFKEEQPVVIAGVGRFGQMVARVLQAKGVPVTLIDVDPNQLELLERFGWKTHYGDARRPDVLLAAGIDQAQLYVVAIDDPEAVLQTVQYVQSHYPNVKIIARARNRLQAFELTDLQVPAIRETFESSMSAAQLALELLGTPPDEAKRNVEDFRQYDQKMLLETASKRHDNKQLVAAAARSRQELANLLGEDQSVRQAPNSKTSS